MRSLALNIALIAAFCSVSILSTHSTAAAPQELKVVRITPQGEDVSATMVVVEFNRPVVPVGKMDRTAEEVGVTLTPAVNCQWRWLNTSSLACQLNDKDLLHPATKYTIHIEPKITALDGAHIAAPIDHTFITERPNILYKDFGKWKGPSFPSIRVVFNQPVSKSSVEKALTFKNTQDSTNFAVTASPDENDRDVPDIIPVPGEKIGRASCRERV